MRFHRGLPALLVLGSVAAMVGCGDGDDDWSKTAVPVTVMTRNLYLGADIAGVAFSQTIEEVRPKVTQIWADVQASDFPARAQLIADEIAAASPHLVGLQEVSLYRIQAPGDFGPGATAANATTVALDFLTLVTDALAARRLSYVVVNVATNGDAELPGGDATLPFDLRLTDRDVILARSDVGVTEPAVGHFATNLTLPVGGAGGVPVTFLRGWSSVAADVGGAHFHFVNSHLEVGGAAFIQEPQAMEFVTATNALPDPLLVVGDFNSAVDGSTTKSYAMLTKRMSDSYALVHPGDATQTCCHDGDLKNATFAGGERIDLILQRGAVRAQAAHIVGIDPALKTPSGLWPSDHAGVVATLGVRPRSK
jgi:hypothetical protein